MPVTVHREVSPWDAHIVAGRLRAEGLHPSLFSEHVAFVMWRGSLAVGMVQIQVPPHEAAPARRVLDDWRAGHYHEALEHELALPPTARCPRCSHHDWAVLRRGDSRLLACVMFWWGAIFPPELAGRRCHACGHVQRLAPLADGRATPTDPHP